MTGKIRCFILSGKKASFLYPFIGLALTIPYAPTEHVAAADIMTDEILTMDSVIPSPASKTAKPAFDWADPFALDIQLSEDDRPVRDTAAYAKTGLPRVS